MRAAVAVVITLPLAFACAIQAPAAVGDHVVAPAEATRPRAAATAGGDAVGWWRDDVFYEIYPRSFSDSNGDGRGDIIGITQRLDDLRALGVDSLWLTPIHPTLSEHGYDVLDYEAVASDLGTVKDVEALTRAAHERGMHVILDFVLNHTSVEHPWFGSERRAHPDYYVWRDAPDDRWRRWDNAPVFHRDDTTGRYYLGVFWSGMPDLNLANPDVVAAMTHAMRFWLDRGVDGFRIDAARHLVEVVDADGVHMSDTAATHELMRRMRADIRSTHPHTLLVAEAWASSAEIASYTNEYDLVFSFGVAGGLVDALVDDGRGPLVEALQGAEAAFASQGRRDGRAHEAPFLTNHDMVRIMRRLDGDVVRAKLGAAVLLALPGTPFLYYGEEIGMQGLPGDDDANKRTRLGWSDVDAQRSDPTSLWRTYQALLALRHAHSALTIGDAVRPTVHGGGRGAFALVRSDGHERVLFVANFARESARDFVVECASSTPRLLFGATDGVVAAEGGALRIAIAPHAFAFIALDR